MTCFGGDGGNGVDIAVGYWGGEGVCGGMGVVAEGIVEEWIGCCRRLEQGFDPFMCILYRVKEVWSIREVQGVFMLGVAGEVLIHVNFMKAGAVSVVYEVDSIGSCFVAGHLKEVTGSSRRWGHYFLLSLGCSQKPLFGGQRLAGGGARL